MCGGSACCKRSNGRGCRSREWPLGPERQPLSRVPGYGGLRSRPTSLSEVTFQEVSEKTGIPVELLMVIREAVGFAEPQPEDRLRDNELQIVPLVEAQISEGFRLTVIERWLRVYGDSLRRIAGTEVDWWHTEVELPLLKSG
jgi:hypothetical protein